MSRPYIPLFATLQHGPVLFVTDSSVISICASSNVLRLVQVMSMLTGLSRLHPFHVLPSTLEENVLITFPYDISYIYMNDGMYMDDI